LKYQAISAKRIAENETMMTIPATIDFTIHSVADEPADDSSYASVSDAHFADTRSGGIASSVTELIGDTPLVRLNRVASDVDATIAVKVEYLNPGGSSKDRIAQRIIEAAERSGQLKPGGVIVEPTSGNTGVGLALVAQQRGYRTIFVLPDKVSESKRAVLRAYSAEVVVTPTNVEPQDPRSYYQVSDRLARTIPGAFKPNQYSNENGPLSHYETTGPEIWRDSEHRVTHFVAGIGTGGTISGTGRYLKEVSDGAVTVVGADPEGSIYSDPANVHVYDIEGVGEDFYPKAFDQSIPDSIVQISDEQAFLMTRRLAREEGLLVGGSSGMAVAAAVQYARDHHLAADDLVVVLLPDSGRGYLDKIFDDEWMRAHGYADVVEATTPEPLVGADGEVRVPANVIGGTGTDVASDAKEASSVTA
jgi:cystathionine beta-synthase